MPSYLQDKMELNNNIKDFVRFKSSLVDQDKKMMVTFCASG